MPPRKAMTVRKLMAELIKMNPEASVQIGSVEDTKFLSAADKVIYHIPKDVGKDPKNADFVAILPEEY